MKESGIGPIWWFTGAQNTASKNSSKSNTSAWAASTGKTCIRAATYTWREVITTTYVSGWI